MASTLIVLYKSFVRSILDYGCFIYYTSKKNHTEKLEKIQFFGIRLALGYRISTLTNILIAESKLSYIEERVKFLCNSYLNKVLSNNNLLISKTITRLKNILTNKYKKGKFTNSLILKCITEHDTSKYIFTSNNFNLYIHQYQLLFKNININLQFGKQLKPDENINIKVEKVISSDNAYAIYTDGSKSANSVSTGSACYCPNLNKSITSSIVKFASVFTAECIAINDAVKLALTRPNENVDIFTDSLSALQTLENTKLNVKINPYILEIKNNIDKFVLNTKNNSTIKLYWIPAHKGINGNEVADALAKEMPTYLSKYLSQIFKKSTKKDRTKIRLTWLQSKESLKESITFLIYLKIMRNHGTII